MSLYVNRVHRFAIQLPEGWRVKHLAEGSPKCSSIRNQSPTRPLARRWKCMSSRGAQTAVDGLMSEFEYPPEWHDSHSVRRSLSATAEQYARGRERRRAGASTATAPASMHYIIERGPSGGCDRPDVSGRNSPSNKCTQARCRCSRADAVFFKPKPKTRHAVACPAWSARGWAMPGPGSAAATARSVIRATPFRFPGRAGDRTVLGPELPDTGLPINLVIGRPLGGHAWLGCLQLAAQVS